MNYLPGFYCLICLTVINMLKCTVKLHLCIILMKVKMNVLSIQILYNTCMYLIIYTVIISYKLLSSSQDHKKGKSLPSAD